MSKIIILDACSLPPDFDYKIFREGLEWTVYEQTSANEVGARLEGADIAVLSKTPINRDTLARCPSLQHIAVAATGFNIVDIAACRDHGVSVSHIPSYAATTVAEHVLACALVLRRKILASRQAVLSGAWEQAAGFCLFGQQFDNLNAATLGIIGLGEIGRKTASVARALGMNVVFTARSPVDHWAEQLELEQLLAVSDIVSLHCSLNETTHKLINRERLRLMQPDSILINTARGDLIDEQAVAQALINHEIGGLASDVLSIEPPKANSIGQASPILELANQPNVIITPHNSWTSRDTLIQLQKILRHNIQSFLDGKPSNLVTT